ncbi:induced myeloid leukemia cell differentiation protein Mcl-1 [Mixophyes fleayi]|uniref:induced myeloid leukemia cell differentiation protein Mcl-1 n=1 Tax=Mixophyes fleayi TaxID=3061075 RepID=UPI003F4DFD9C
MTDSSLSDHCEDVSPAGSPIHGRREEPSEGAVCDVCGQPVLILQSSLTADPPQGTDLLPVAMMNPTLMRKSAMIPCQLLYGGGGVGLPSKPGQLEAGSSLLSLEKEQWEKGYSTDGSLPNSQGELDEDEDVESGSRGSTSPPPSPVCLMDPLCTQTREILCSLFREQAGGKKGAGGNLKILVTLRRVGAEINEKHKMAFQGMLQRLSIQTPEDIQKLSDVPSMVFSDGITNWGRIVTLISFGAFVAKHLKSIQMENCIGSLADSFTEYLMTSKREWISQHNGWEGCVEFFHVEDYEGGLRTVLMAFAGVAGLGASLAYMIR